MKCYVYYFAAWLLALTACQGNGDSLKKEYREAIGPEEQERIFDQLRQLTGNAIPELELSDSLSFFVIPIENTCPSCRKKAIESIVRYSKSLSKSQFVVISGMGKRVIESYFKEQDHTLPVGAPGIFIDSTNISVQQNIVSTKPEIYYTSGNKAYAKVYCYPNNIKQELKGFFKEH